MKKMMMLNFLLCLGTLGVAERVDRIPEIPTGQDAYQEAYSGQSNWVRAPIPEIALEQIKPNAILDVELKIESLKGTCRLNSPRLGLMDVKKDTIIKGWDRLQMGPKSELILTQGSEVKYKLGSGSIAQIISHGDDRFFIRLLKGKLRVINSGDGKSRIETLNAELFIQKGTIDVIISAMNTLVAPREGEATRVKTKKHNQDVKAGVYGLVMADGSLLFSGE